MQGHFDPWHPRLLNKTEAQLDAILEAYAEDFPNKLKFERRKDQRARDAVQTLSLLWEERLIGEGRERLRRKVSFKIPDHIRNPIRTPQPPRPAARRK